MALFHVVVVWVVSRPVFIASGNVDPPLQVVFIQRPRAKPQPVGKIEREISAQERKTEAPARSEAPLRVVDHVESISNPIPVVRDDAWDRSEVTPADGITFMRNPLVSTYNPIPNSAPGRFRMRRQLSPEDIVRGVSQVLGFWPPGYTDDPCAGLDKAVEMFTSARTRREQGLLADAMREREKYCK
ncbi:hypothetical protein [Thermomonas brevis]